MRRLSARGGAYGRAEGISDDGRVVGYLLDAEWIQHAAVWGPDSSVALLDGSPGWVEANARNERGLVVGLVGNLPVRWTGGGPPEELDCVVELGVACAVNHSGLVAGASDLPGYPSHSEAHLWSADGGCHPLGRLGAGDSAALDLNDAGEVVGRSSLVPYGPTVAVYWGADRVLRELAPFAPEGWALEAAVSINRPGDILCLARDESGVRQPAVLWRADPSEVPPRGRTRAVALSLRLLPNPSRGSVRLALDSPRAGLARVRLFDAAGRLRKEFAREVPAGPSEIPWIDPAEGVGLARGIYLVRVDGPGGASAQERMVRLAGPAGGGDR